MSAIPDLLKSAGAVSAVALGPCFTAMPVRATPRMPVARTEAARFMNRAFVACALVTFGLIASHTSAFAGKRVCSMVEASHVSEYNFLACNNSGGSVYCDETTGAAYCCKSTPGGLSCGSVISTLTTSPPGPRPPGVKIDTPRVDSVSPPKNPTRPPRFDPPPSSVAPMKPPAGPVVR